MDEELLARIGAVTRSLTRRATEVPYHQPPVLLIYRGEEALHLDELDPTQRDLWVVAPDGTLLLAPESQPGFGVKSDLPEGRRVKHGDLVPGRGGAHRGYARAGGELSAVLDPEGIPSGRWELNNNSSYTFNREDARPLGEERLHAVIELLQRNGTDISRLERRFIDYTA